MPHDARSLFEDAIDIPIWLEDDQDTPFTTRAVRDRDIAQRCSAQTPIHRIGYWWNATRSAEGLGARLARGRRLVTALLVVAGAVVGSGFAAAALRYDGTYPVNVVTAFGLLVGVQLVMMALTLLLLPGGRFRMPVLQDMLGTFNPAVIAAAAYRRFAALPDSVARLFAWHAGRSAANRFAKWQLLFWSQCAAVAFNIAALVTAIALVTFTDLAFGWSTTLDVGTREVHALTQVISAPWQVIAPAAVPDAVLIENSRFFRLEDATTIPRRPEAFTPWWPFIVSALLVYGLLPRVLLCILAAIRLRGATRALLLEDPRVAALLDRMNAPALALAAEVAEKPGAARREEPAHLGETVGGAAAVVIWAGTIDPAAAASTLRAKLGFALLANAFEAGGATSLDDDRRVIERIAGLSPRHVVLFTRAWEPPLLELLDFISALRRRLADDPSVVVVPVAQTPTEPVTGTQLDAWRRTVATLHDSRVYVEPGQ